MLGCANDSFASCAFGACLATVTESSNLTAGGLDLEVLETECVCDDGFKHDEMVTIQRNCSVPIAFDDAFIGAIVCLSMLALCGGVWKRRKAHSGMVCILDGHIAHCVANALYWGSWWTSHGEWTHFTTVGYVLMVLASFRLMSAIAVANLSVSMSGPWVANGKELVVKTRSRLRILEALAATVLLVVLILNRNLNREDDIDTYNVLQAFATQLIFSAFLGCFILAVVASSREFAKILVDTSNASPSMDRRISAVLKRQSQLQMLLVAGYIGAVSGRFVLFGVLLAYESTIPFHYVAIMADSLVHFKVCCILPLVFVKTPKTSGTAVVPSATTGSQAFKKSKTSLS